LSAAKYAVLIACQPDDIAKILEEKKIDIMIVSQELCEDHAELVTLARQTNSAICIVMLAEAMTQPESRFSEAVRSHVDLVLSGPFSESDLYAAVLECQTQYLTCRL